MAKISVKFVNGFMLTERNRANALIVILIQKGMKDCMIGASISLIKL